MVKPSKEPGILAETWETLNTYWFGFGSPTALGLFRILITSLTTLNLLMISLDWDGWLSEKGFIPAWLGARYINYRVALGFGTNWSVPIIDLLNGVTNPYLAMAFFAIVVIAGFLTIFGYYTRISSIVFAIGLVSIQHRNGAILYGGDTVMRVCALYVAIAPSGAACSVDRLIGLWKGRISRVPVEVSMWPQRLVCYNVALTYLTTTWLKWGGGRWQNGTATYYPARLAEFYRFPIPKWVNDFPMVYITTYGTLATEFALGTLVFFRPLRKYVLVAGILMHAHIEFSMNVPLFSYLMISTYLLFYDGEEVTGWAKRLGERLSKKRIRVFLPKGRKFTAEGQAFLTAIDPLGLVEYSVGNESEFVALDGQDRQIPPGRAIFTHSVGAWSFGWIPGIWAKILSKAMVPVIEATTSPR